MLVLLLDDGWIELRLKKQNKKLYLTAGIQSVLPAKIIQCVWLQCESHSVELSSCNMAMDGT